MKIFLNAFLICTGQSYMQLQNNKTIQLMTYIKILILLIKKKGLTKNSDDPGTFKSAL